MIIVESKGGSYNVLFISLNNIYFYAFSKLCAKEENQKKKGFLLYYGITLYLTYTKSYTDDQGDVICNKLKHYIGFFLYHLAP